VVDFGQPNAGHPARLRSGTVFVPVLAMRLPLLILALAASSAHAEPPGLTPLAVPMALPAPVPVEVPASSYRIQTVLADAAAVGLMVAATKAEDGDRLGTAGVFMYALGGPAVHLFNHHPGRAAASLALRVGLPMLGALLGGSIGQCTSNCEDSYSGLAGALLGMLTGAVVASAIDIGYLSRGETAMSQPAGVAPSFGAGGGTVRLGLGGSF
jgi:hypothetical protein